MRKLVLRDQTHDKLKNKCGKSQELTQEFAHILLT